jgi:hypothetical protein
VNRKRAFEIGQLAQSLARGYGASAASLEVLRHPHTMAVVEQLEFERPAGELVAGHQIVRKDGTVILSNLSHYVREVEPEHEHRAMVDRLWWIGALLTLGDAIADADLDRGPDLEFIRHLRNGVAHGNRFHFRNGEPRRPAFFFGPLGRFLPNRAIIECDVPEFRIEASLEGSPVLFDYVGAGDLYDLFLFVSWRLIRFGNGDDDMPLYPQHRSE